MASVAKYVFISPVAQDPAFTLSVRKIDLTFVILQGIQETEGFIRGHMVVGGRSLVRFLIRRFIRRVQFAQVPFLFPWCGFRLRLLLTLVP